MPTDTAAPPLGELMALAGRRVLVTGASGNIGRAIAIRLAEAGASILAHWHRDEGAALALAGRIAAMGGECLPCRADLAQPGEVERLFADLDGRGLEVDGLVNNAALQPVRAFDEIEAGEWRAMQSANLDAAFLLIQAAARRMTGRGGGAIVNVGSIEGRDPAPGHAHYAVSKAGLAMLTRAAALELGPRGIRVNCVSPGLIDRDGLADAWPDGVARWLERAPLGRLGTGADVADAVLFLLSGASRWISGADLLVDGGMSAVSRW
ncbi:MAG: SDR family oxidoreductase [Gammaproteobacteria bacterium]|nr:SDR family oxidoreductase [Gammaproteobacteria bacterium]MDH4254206.1 SDR family oxidoreductase [Gammaproteobacteria bacterium]MDH5309023.1 SDR family oxidoreductase [Gammaproteobacteria bacterium]